MAGPLLASLASPVPAVYGLGVALLTTPVGWFALAVAAIAYSAVKIYRNWDGIKGFFAGIRSSVGKVLAGMAEAFVGLQNLDLAAEEASTAAPVPPSAAALMSISGTSAKPLLGACQHRAP